MRSRVARVRWFCPKTHDESISSVYFFFNDTAPTEIYTLSLHDALPILPIDLGAAWPQGRRTYSGGRCARSEEHTSELQSRVELVCRLLLEKKNESTRGYS